MLRGEEAYILSLDETEKAVNKQSAVGDKVGESVITINDATNGRFTYLKNNGYIIQDGEPTPDAQVEIQGLGDSGSIEVKTAGKNLLGGLALAQALVDSGSDSVVLDESAGTVKYNRKLNGAYVLFNKFKPNTQYTIITNGTTGSSGGYINFRIKYTDETQSVFKLGKFISTENKTIRELQYVNQDAYSTTLNYNECGIFEGVISEDDFEPYEETVANIPIESSLYEGDYIEIYSDGSGELVRAWERFIFDGSDDEGWSVTNPNVDTTRYFYCHIGEYEEYKNVTCRCTHFKNYAIYASNTHIGIGVVNSSSATADRIAVRPGVEGVKTTAAWKAWLAENNITVLCKRTEPTRTQLTEEQVTEFKKLYTFEPITNVLADGVVEVGYFKNNLNGVTFRNIQIQIDALNAKLQ